MKKLIISGDDVAKYMGQRASSSAPSLSAAARFAKDASAVAKFNHDKAIEEGFKNVQYGTQDDNGRPVDVLEARMGRMMTDKQIEKRLKKLNPNIICHVNQFQNKFIEVCLPDPTNKFSGRKFIVAFERGYVPEFTVVQFKTERRIIRNENHIPTWENVKEYSGEKRGWRKILLSLIKAKVINKTRAEKVFGLPSHESARWTEALNED